MTEGHEVIIATDGYPLQLLRQHFPSLQFIELHSYNIRYSKSKTQVFAMIRNLPFILLGIFKEHHWLKQWAKFEKPDQVISDNRFGLWCRQAHTIFITHQLMIKLPMSMKLLEPLLWLIHRLIISQFDECWIPDQAGNENFSGDLSHLYPLPHKAKFIGILSRFSLIKVIQPDNTFQVVAIVSGLEPQRTLFANYLLKRFKSSPFKTLILAGQPDTLEITHQVGSITYVSHRSDTEIASFLLGAKKIVARSGYTTIMDLATLGCLDKTEWFPTPGQTEQEYLATIIESKKESAESTI